MAVKLDATLDAYTVPLGVANLPNSDWTVGLYVKIDDNSGSLFQYALCTRDAVTQGDAYFFYMFEDGRADAGKWQVRINKNNGTAVVDTATSNVFGGDGVGRFYFLRRSGNVFTLHSIIPSRKPTLEMTVTSTAWQASSNGREFSVGKRNDENADRYLKGEVAEVFKMDGALSLDEMVMLANGETILELGYRPEIYLPLKTAESKPINLGNGSIKYADMEGNPTTVNHPLKVNNTINFKKLQVVIPPATGLPPLRRRLMSVA